MYALRVVIAIALAIILQVGLSSLFGRWFSYVDLPLIVTIYVSLKRSQFAGMFTGALAGLALDATTHPILGINGLIKTVLGFVVATFSVRFELDSSLLRLLTMTIAAAANAAMFIGLNKLMKLPQFLELPNNQVWRYIGIHTSINLAVAIIIFVLLDKLFGRSDPGKVETVRKYYR